MISFKKLSEQIVNFLLAVILCFSFVLAVTDSLQFKFNPLLLLLFIFISMLLCFITLQNKRTAILTLFSIGILLISGTILLLAKGLFQTLIYDFWVFIYWVIDFVQGFGTYERAYALILTIAISFGISLFVYFFAAKYFKFLILLLAGSSLFISQWMNNFFTSYFSLYVFLFIIVIYYFRYIYIKNSQLGPNSFVNITVFTAWILPISAIILLISFSLHPKMEAMQWKWLDHKINGVFNYFNKSFLSYKTSDYFSIANSGFGDNSILGGKVRLNKTVVLKVDSPRIVYLKGSSKDYYSGLTWRSSDKSSTPLDNTTNELNQNTMNFILSLHNYNNVNEIKDFFYNDTLKITFMNFKSKSLFITSFTNKINFSENKAIKAFVNADGTLTSSKVLSKNFSYSIDVLSPKYDGKSFIKMLKGSKLGSYAENPFDANIKANLTIYNLSNRNSIVTWNENKKRYIVREVMGSMNSNSVSKNNVISNDTSTDTNENTFEVNNDFTIDYRIPEVKAYFDKINKLYDKYMQIPATLPTRVKSLAESITSTKTNTYDKVKAIEQYLATKYPYTLKPNSTPTNRDFVDYFLFDLKEGYCTYFATAMTMMVRSIGVPARYVEGYILPPTAKSNKTFEVTNEQAHAWVEVYFEGIGWIPFEPTSVFRSAFYNNKDYTPSLGTSIINNPAYNSYLEMMGKYRTQGQGGANLNLSGIDFNVKDDNNKRQIITFSIIFFLTICFICLIGANSFKHKLKLRKMYNLEPRESIIEHYLYYLKTLVLTNMGIQPGETPGQYSERIDSYLDLGSKNNFRDVTEKFIISRYSQNGISLYDKQLVADFNPYLQAKTKKEINKFKFFILKYLLGRI